MTRSEPPKSCGRPATQRKPRRGEYIVYSTTTRSQPMLSPTHVRENRFHSRATHGTRTNKTLSNPKVLIKQDIELI